MAADENACDAGDFESCDNLGLAYIGIKLEECDLDKNYEKAFALFKKACAYGWNDVCKAAEAMEKAAKL